MASPTTRGRPAVLEKAELPLPDGTKVTLTLVGEGDTIQLVIPLQWNVESFARSITASGGRTKMSFVAVEPPSAEDAPATNGKKKPAKK